MMLSTIKTYLSVFIGALVMGFLAYVKYLRMTNETQKENIERLKREIEVTKEVSKDEVKRAIFEAKQKERTIALKRAEITLDEIEKEVKRNENSNSDFSDDFSVSRV